MSVAHGRCKAVAMGLMSGRDTRERRRCGISAPPARHRYRLSTPDVLESESFIEGYGQSIDAAPTVLLLFSGNFHPSESLRDPEGLRTCRPEAGLGFPLN